MLGISVLMPEVAKNISAAPHYFQLFALHRTRVTNCKLHDRRQLFRGCYFHSQSVERLFPSASTSYSKIAATLFSRDHFGDELW